MNTYLRLLRFAQPIGKKAVPFVLFSVLYTFFGVINFVMLAPVLEVLFGVGNAAQEASTLEQAPEFVLKPAYAKEAFYYYFSRIIAGYGKFYALLYVSGVVLVSVFLTNLFRFLSQRILATLNVRVLYNLRRAMFEQLIAMDLGYFANKQKGDIMSRFTNDVIEVRNGLTGTFTSFLREPFMVVGYFVGLFALSARLTFFSLIIVPVTGLLISVVMKSLKRYARSSQVSIGQISSILEEVLNGQRIIKAFNAQNYINGKLDKENRQFRHQMYLLKTREVMLAPTSEFLGVAVVVMVVVYGGYLILSGDSEAALSPQLFIPYVALMSQVMRPVKSIASNLGSIPKSLSAGERIFELLDSQPQLTNKPDAHKLEAFRQGIEFCNVGFAYGEQPVLQNINFRIGKGETVALVGPSGSGKSTIADLLPRFYDVSQGQILVDGYDIRDLDYHSLRQHFGIVTQEAILFHDTVYNNIAFAKAEATEKEVREAARIANAESFIEQLEAGYHTRIGDRGLKLSGGQRQRISIARAILYNPEILILDEATSALDTESEKLVQQALDHLMAQRTSLVIAHRLSTIKHADKILVLDQGRIVEAGTHAELLQLEAGLYRKLSQLQEMA